MCYIFILKIIHVVVGSLLFAAGLGSACYVLYAHRRSDIEFEYRALCASWRISWFAIVPLGMLQALLGFSIIAVKGYSIHDLWVLVAYLGFFVAAILWVVSLFFQMQCKDQLKLAVNSKISVSSSYGNNFSLLVGVWLRYCIGIDGDDIFYGK